MKINVWITWLSVQKMNIKVRSQRLKTRQGKKGNRFVNGFATRVLLIEISSEKKSLQGAGVNKSHA